MFWLEEFEIGGFFTDFAEDCKHIGSGNYFKVLFKSEFAQSMPFSGVDITGSSPTITVKNSDIDNVPLNESDTVILRNITYRINTIKLNVNGISQIELDLMD